MGLFLVTGLGLNLAGDPDTGPVSNFAVVVLGIVAAMLAFGLIALANSLRVAWVIRRYDWLAQVVHALDAHGNLLVGNANGPVSALLWVPVLPWRKARFQTARKVWLAAPDRGRFRGSVIALENGGDLAWCMRVRPKGMDYSQVVAPVRDSASTTPAPAAEQVAAGAEPESVPQRRRRRIAAISLIVIGLVAWLVLAYMSRGSGTGDSTVASATADPMAGLTPGDCFDVSNTQSAVLPCAQPHDNEVYYRYMLPPGPFPGASPDPVSSTCDAHLSDYVGSVHAAAFFDWPLPLDPSEWAAGDRFAVCALARMDNGKMTGSARQPH